MNFKTKKAAERFKLMHPAAQALAEEMDRWAREQGVDLVFTATKSTLEEDKKLGRKSDTHRTGRAFDIRTKGLSQEFIYTFLERFNFEYGDSIGAITSDGIPKLIVYKPHGTGPHFHVQIRRGLKE